MKLALWTDFQSAGGERIGEFMPVSGSVVHRLDSTHSGTMEMSAERWRDLGGDIGLVVRIEWPDTTVEEWRIQKVPPVEAIAPTIAFEIVPVWSDLAERGSVLSVVGGEAVTQITAELALSTWCNQYILAHESAQRLSLALGALERDPVLVGDYDAPTPWEMLLDLMARAGLEPEIVRVSDAQWQLNGRLARGSEIAPFVSRPGRNELAKALGLDRANLATVVMPLGDAHPETGNRATIANVRYDIAGLPGSGWVQLIDYETDESPIVVDTQWKGAALRLSDGTTRPILDSRVSDGAVQIASTSGLSVGHRIGLATVDGAPLVEVFDVDAFTERGRRVVKLPLSGFRGEANEIINGRFRDGMTGWEDYNPSSPSSWAELYRSELGETFSFQAKGSRAGGTAGSTPFPCDGLPVGKRLVRGDVLTAIGSTHAIDTAAIPDTNGALSVHLATGLPANYADNDPIPLVRREIASGTIVNAGPLASGRLMLDIGDADLAQRLAAFARCDGYGGRFTGPGDVRVTGPAATSFENNWNAMYVHEDDPEVLVCQYSSVVGGSAPAPSVVVTGGAIVAGAQRMRVYVPDNSITGTIMLHFVWNGGGTAIPEWLYDQSGGGVLKLIGPIVGSGTAGPNQYVDFDVTGLPAATDFTGMTGYAAGVPIFDESSPPKWIGNEQRMFVFSDSWTGSFTITWHRETRVARVNGSHSSGATTVALKALSAIRRRNWASSDTLMTAVGTFAVTGTGTWGTDGLATVPTTVPSGVTLRAGEKVWSNWHGTSALDTAMIVATTVVGPASAVVVRGSDTYRAPWVTSDAPLVACYRIGPGSYFEIAGTQVVVAATVVADGAGEASPTLTGANANTIADNATITVTRAQHLRPEDPTDGSVVRLLAPNGSPTGLSPAPLSNLYRFLVPAGSTRRVTAFVTVSLSVGTYTTAEQPSVGLLDQNNNMVVVAKLAETSVSVVQTPTIARIILPWDLTASQWLRLGLYGGPTDPNQSIVVLDAMLVFTDREDVPFTESALANRMAQLGTDMLTLRRIPAADVTIDIAILSRWCEAPATSAPVALGQRVVVSDVLTRRIAQYERSVIDPSRILVQVGELPTEETRQLSLQAAA